MLVVLLSVYVLFVPRPAGPEGPPGADKAVHLLLFALLAGTGRWSADRTTVLLAVLAYAGLSELVQALALPERSGDLLDVVADVVGALLGWHLAGRLLRR